MLANPKPNFLLASAQPGLLKALESLLQANGAHVHIAISADAVLPFLDSPAPQSLLLVDAGLPGMEIGRLLVAADQAVNPRTFPIVLISDTVTQELLDLLESGIVDDIVPGSAEAPFWMVRLNNALRSRRLACDMESLRESLALSALYDRRTGIYNREAMLAMLFRETDRVQRMNSSLCMVLFDVDDFGHWNDRLGEQACDELLRQIVNRTARLLRSYDLLGRVGNDEFLVAMPGCSGVSAVMLAERLRLEVFTAPFQAAGKAIRLSACFGISSSNGRSPLVVLREAEQALEWAREQGPEIIRCFGKCPPLAAGPVTFLFPSSGDELLAW
jgi:two-component system, cell cycle response regulator